MNRFILQTSQDLPGWWVLTDTENEIVVKFKDKDFNGTQKVTPLNDDSVILAKAGGALGFARVMREIGDYVARHHGDIAFKQPYGWKYSEDDEELIFYRNKSPKWELHLLTDTNKETLASSLRKAAEFVIKGERNDKNI